MLGTQVLEDDLRLLAPECPGFCLGFLENTLGKGGKVNGKTEISPGVTEWRVIGP